MINNDEQEQQEIITYYHLNLDQIGSDDEDVPQSSNEFINFILKLLWLFAFQIYLVYWIPKKICLLLFNYAKALIFLILVNPIALFLWTPIITNGRMQPRITWHLLPVLLGIIAFSSILYASNNLIETRPGDLTTTKIPRSFFSAEGLPAASTKEDEYEELQMMNLNSLEKVLNLIKTMSENNAKVWEALLEEASEVRAKIGDIKSLFETEIKNMWSRISEQQNHIENIEKEVWSELDRRQSEFENLYKDQLLLMRETLHKDIEYIIEKHRSTDIVVARFIDEDEEPKFSTNALVELLSDNLLADQKLVGGSSLEHVISKYIIQNYHQDVLNLADFALKFRGAKILHSKTSRTYYHLPVWKQALRQILGLSPANANFPEMAISPQTDFGQCWSMYGDKGNLGIILSEPIYIHGMTVEYPSKEIMLDLMKNAPRDIELYGIPHETPDKQRIKTPVFLGSVTFDIGNNKEYSAIQTFGVNTGGYSDMVFQAVQIKILSNWGNPDLTDIYRIRIHGVPPRI